MLFFARCHTYYYYTFIDCDLSVWRKSYSPVCCHTASISVLAVLIKCCLVVFVDVAEVAWTRDFHWDRANVHFHRTRTTFLHEAHHLVILHWSLFSLFFFFKASTYLFLPNCFYRVGWALGKVSSELLQMLHQGDPWWSWPDVSMAVCWPIKQNLRTAGKDCY